MTSFKNTLFALVCATFIAFAPSAHASTTVFAGSVINQTNVTNSGGALGGADGSGATIGGQGFLFGVFPFSTAGNLDLAFSSPVSGAGVSLDFLGSGLVGFLDVSLGAVVGGTTVFTTAQTLTIGTGGGNFILDFSADCATLAATGCSIIRLTNNGGFFQGASILDGVSGVASAPEPATWALMILGFAGIGARLKQTRAHAPLSKRVAGRARSATGFAHGTSGALAIA